MDKLEGVAADVVLRRMSELPLDRAAFEANRAIGIQDGDEIEGIFREVAEVVFAPADTFQAGGSVRQIDLGAKAAGTLLLKRTPELGGFGFESGKIHSAGGRE